MAPYKKGFALVREENAGPAGEVFTRGYWDRYVGSFGRGLRSEHVTFVSWAIDSFLLEIRDEQASFHDGTLMVGFEVCLKAGGEELEIMSQWHLTSPIVSPTPFETALVLEALFDPRKLALCVGLDFALRLVEWWYGGR